MRVVVTGAAGMIGANLVHGLNAIGIDDVIAVDDLTDGPKYRNLLGAPDQRLLRPARLLRALRAPASSAASMPCSTKAPAPTPWSTTAASCSRPTTAARRTCSTPARRRARGCSTRRRPRPTAAAPRSARSPSSSGRSTSTATRSCCSTTSCAACCPRPRHAGRGLSLLQRLRPARAAQGRAWPRSRSTISTSFASTARSSSSATTAATRPGEQSRDFVFVDDVVAVNLWFLAAPAVERHLQPRHRPRPAVQRRRRGASSTPARALAASRRCRCTSWSPQGSIEYIDFPAGAGRQVPVLHPGRPDAAARHRLRPRLRRRGDRRRSLRGVAFEGGLISARGRGARRVSTRTPRAPRPGAAPARQRSSAASVG